MPASFSNLMMAQENANTLARNGNEREVGPLVYDISTLRPRYRFVFIKDRNGAPLHRMAAADGAGKCKHNNTGRRRSQSYANFQGWAHTDEQESRREFVDLRPNKTAVPLVRWKGLLMNLDRGQRKVEFGVGFFQMEHTDLEKEGFLRVKIRTYWVSEK